MYPEAVKTGMSKKEFLHSTIKELRIHIKAWKEQKEEEIEEKNKTIDYQAWLNGAYVSLAIAGILSKKNSYPSKPFGNDAKNQKEEENDAPQKTEAELREEERYFELLIRQANANIAEVGKEKGRQD